MEALIPSAKQQRSPFQSTLGRNLVSGKEHLDKTDKEIIAACAYYNQINHYSEPELRDGTTILLTKLGVMYGIRQAPEKEEMAFILRKMPEVFGYYTLEEVEKAADMNLSGYFNPKVIPYQWITLDFISNLMMAYSRFRNEAIAKAKSVSENTDIKSSKEKGYRNEDYYNTFINWTNDNGKYPLFWNWKAIYEHIEEQNLFFDTVEQREAFRKEIETGTNLELRKKKIQENDPIKAGTLAEKIISKYYAKNEFHQAYVIRFMDGSGLIKPEIVNKDYNL